MLLLIASSSGVKQTQFFNIEKIIKQLNPLLFLFFVLSILISPSAFTKQEVLFAKTANLFSILQDKKDFIWLSGQNGLYRFDGKQVINFSNKEKGWSIPFNWIHNTSIKGNSLILSTETKGLWLFDTETGETQPIQINSESKTFYRAIHHKGSYYAISMAPQHLYRYDIATSKTTLLAKDINNDLLFSSKNRVYFNNGKQLFYLDGNQQNNQVQQLNTNNEEIVTATNIKDVVILASKNSLFSINDNGKTIQKHISNPISVITSSNDQQAIFSVDASGNIIKREVKTLNELSSSFPTVKKSRYQTLLHDNSGVLWLGNNSGVQQLTETKIKNHPIIFDTPFNYNETDVYKGELYLGSYGQGMHTFSPLTKQKALPLKHINQHLSNKAKDIADLLAIDQNLFIATFDGLWQYNKDKLQTQKINLSFESTDLSKLILLKLKYQKNLLYIATDGQGLIIYDLNKKVVIQHIDESAGLSSGEVIDALPLANGEVWLATASGIDIVNKHTQTVQNITMQTSAKFISLLQIDSKIFASTKGNGIQVYNLQGELLIQFAKGISFSRMSFVDGDILASAKPGLYKINAKNYQFAMVTNTNKFYFTDNPLIFNNTLLIANSTGILQLPRTTTPAFHPKIYISKTTVSGQSYLLNKLIEVDSGNDVITLELASLDYRPGLEKQYRYTLNGTKWHQIHGNQLTLTGLASGEYHIEIMATNSLGQWSNFKAFANIKVAFPWYWTPQIRLFYGIFLFCIISFTTWLLYLRSKSIGHIHDILKRDTNNYGKTNQQIKRNLTLTQKLISEGDIEKSQSLLKQCLDDLNSHPSSPEPNALEGKTLAIALPFFANYLHHKYQVNLTYQLNISDDTLNYELQSDLYRVIFEAITSVVLKGSGRNFKVILQTFKNKIWLNIYDDYQGFNHFNSKINFDISMYYIRQIAKKHNGSINTFKEQDDGSQLVLSLPLT